MFWTLFLQALSVIAVVLLISFLIQKFLIKLPDNDGQGD